MAIQEKRYTADEFWELSPRLPADKRYELVRGELVEMSPSGEIATTLGVRIAALLFQHVDANDLGEVMGADGGFILSTAPDIVRAPDVAFIAQARLTGPSTPKFFPGAADLAVEVISPGDSLREVEDKVREHLEAGTRLVWAVCFASRTVAVYRPGQEKQVLGLDNVLNGEDVVPGYTLPVREIFQKVRT